MNVLDLFRLDGRTAVVTGGGRGLGEYMAKGLAGAGAKVMLCSRKVEACEEVAGEIEKAGGHARALACDVLDPDDVERVLSTTEDSYGPIDILVNNSGVSWGAPAVEMPIEKFDMVMNVNVRGSFLFAQGFARRAIPRESGGSIINIASVAAYKGAAPGKMETAGYTASKGAVVSMTRDLAGSWARHGIRVNAIAPGWFPTKMSKVVIERGGEDLLSRIPMHRTGGPEDISGVAVFLASPAASFITGQTILVDGGQSIW
jgi:NAD(P)-dependent dehydrogenase (short-subunit alcohol dehydrogenase family)